jgi:putative PIN family toxin of toxin-antitoxin system
MRIVLDTNIFISSFFWGGNPRKLMTRIIDGKDNLFTSVEILQEVFSVMSRPKFNVPSYRVVHFIDSIREISLQVIPTGLVQGVCRDSDDDKILECAVLGDVDFIVSGDNDLLSIKKFCGIPIVTATEYFAILASNNQQ